MLERKKRKKEKWVKQSNKEKEYVKLNQMGCLFCKLSAIKRCIILFFLW